MKNLAIFLFVFGALNFCTSQPLVTLCDVTLNNLDGHPYNLCDHDTMAIYQLDSIVDVFYDIGLDFGYTRTYLAPQSKFTYYSDTRAFENYEIMEFSLLGPSIRLFRAQDVQNFDTINIHISESIFQGELEQVNDYKWCVQLDNYYRLNYYLNDDFTVKAITLSHNED